MDFCPFKQLSLVPNNLFLFPQNFFSLTLLNTALPCFYLFRTQLQKITYLAVSLIELGVFLLVWVFFFFSLFSCLHIKNKFQIFVSRVLPILPSIFICYPSVSLFYTEAYAASFYHLLTKFSEGSLSFFP